MGCGLRLNPLEPRTFLEVRTLIATASELKPTEGQVQADEPISV